MYNDLFSAQSLQDLLTVLPSLPVAIWETFYAVSYTHLGSTVGYFFALFKASYACAAIMARITSSMRWATRQKSSAV